MAQPLISAIVAMDENRVIGNNNQLPWRLPADLKHFKTITLNHPIIMGRKTFESIGKPLPRRTNIIISRNPHLQVDGCAFTKSLEEAIETAREHDKHEIFIIGGAEIFKQALPIIERLYLTIIHETFTGDTFFPEINKDEWHEIAHEAHTADELNNYPYTFITLERISN